MLVKVTAIVETVVYIESDNATKEVEKIISDNCYEALRDDLENCLGDIPLATKEIKEIEELPNGWDAETVPWNTSGKDITCGDILE